MNLYYLMIKEIEQTGLKYLCKRKQNFNPDDHITYRGSGTYWRRVLKAHPEYTLKTTVLGLYNKEDLIKYGTYYSELYNVVESDEWANLMVEKGDGGQSHKGTHPFKNIETGKVIYRKECPEGHIPYISERTPVRKIHNPITGKIKNIDPSEKTPDGWIDGGPKGKYSYGPRKGQTKVYHNGEKKLYINHGDPIPDGFIPGLHHAGSITGRFGCHDPITLEYRYLKKDEPLPNGFILGIPPTSGKKLSSPYGIFESITDCMDVTNLQRPAILNFIQENKGWSYLSEEEFAQFKPYNNGIQTKYIKEDEYIPNGFVSGTHFIGAIKNQVACFNPETLEIKLIDKASSLPDGFILGVNFSNDTKINTPYGIFESITECIEITKLKRYKISQNIKLFSDWFYINESQTPYNSKYTAHTNSEQIIFIKQGDNILDGFTLDNFGIHVKERIICYNPITLQQIYIHEGDDIPYGFKLGKSNASTGDKLNTPYGVFKTVTQCMETTGLDRKIIHRNIKLFDDWFYLEKTSCSPDEKFNAYNNGNQEIFLKNGDSILYGFTKGKLTTNNSTERIRCYNPLTLQHIYIYEGDPLIDGFVLDKHTSEKLAIKTPYGIFKNIQSCSEYTKLSRRIIENYIKNNEDWEYLSEKSYSKPTPYNNGITTKYIKEGDSIPDGFTPGHGSTGSTLNRIVYHNPITLKNMFIKKGDPIPDGFVIGRYSNQGKFVSTPYGVFPSIAKCRKKLQLTQNEFQNNIDTLNDWFFVEKTEPNLPLMSPKD